MQITQISLNLTTNERLNILRYSYLRDKMTGTYRNPYDKGVLKNWLEFFHLLPSEKKPESGHIVWGIHSSYSGVQKSESPSHIYMFLSVIRKHWWYHVSLNTDSLHWCQCSMSDDNRFFSVQYIWTGILFCYQWSTWKMWYWTPFLDPTLVRLGFFH